jgi:pSer/pThr/pTyr-binding forkhead associated (FHA) protein
MAYLVIRQPERPAIRWELNEALVIGRKADCDLCLADQQISRQHCRILRTEAGWRLIDLSSHNGTRINDCLIDQHLLADGDEFEIGRTRIVYRSSSRASAERPADPFQTAITLELENELDELHGLPETEPPASFPRPIVRASFEDAPGESTIDVSPSSDTPGSEPPVPLPFLRPRTRPKVKQDIDTRITFRQHLYEYVIYYRCIIGDALRSLLRIQRQN